jgi:hypothetical protein
MAGINLATGHVECDLGGTEDAQAKTPDVLTTQSSSAAASGSQRNEVFSFGIGPFR